MKGTRLLQLGSVIWAELADVNGIRKIRPAVVVTGTADIVSGGVVRVAAITTRLPVPLPVDYVLLPWNRQGTAHSGLRRKSAAVASWLADLPVDDVQQVVGIISATVMGELLAKLVSPAPPAALPGSASPTTAGPLP